MFIDDATFTRNGKTYRRVLLRNSYRFNGQVCQTPWPIYRTAPMMKSGPLSWPSNTKAS
jgi:hypothetical protein